MCVFWIYKHVYIPYMAAREKAQWAKDAEARAKAAKERANRAKDPGPFKGTSRRAATAKKAREEQVKNYNDRCAAEDAAEKNAAEETAAEEDADEEGTDASVSDEETDEDAADDQGRAVLPSSPPDRRSVRFPETTRDATRENTTTKQGFLETVKKIGSYVPGRHRVRENGRRGNGIQLRSHFKKKYTGPPMEYYM